jgi:hypothetical protein
MKAKDLMLGNLIVHLSKPLEYKYDISFNK